MYSKKITYKDYDDNERTETFYFNLSKAELVEMEMSTAGGMQKMLESIVETKNARKIMEVMKDLILRSYGEKSSDGRQFVKSKELSEAFSQTEAYSELFVELMTDTEEASKFVNGVVPRELAEEAAKQRALIGEVK